jgi:hypothetical protein
VIEQVCADLGQYHAPFHAVEQPHPKLFLERVDLPRQRRLRNVQASGRPSDVLFFGNRDEIFQLSYIHDRAPGKAVLPAYPEITAVSAARSRPYSRIEFKKSDAGRRRRGGITKNVYLTLTIFCTSALSSGVVAKRSHTGLIAFMNSSRFTSSMKVTPCFLR